MSDLELLKNDWSNKLADLFQSSDKQIVISSPFVTQEGINFILNSINRNFHAQGIVTFVTNLTTINLIQGSTDPAALHRLITQQATTEIYHLPRLHAKTYIADMSKAIITSGNLTSGGLMHNYEYGVYITDEQVVSRIHADIISYAQLGAKVSKESLLSYCMAVEQAKEAFKLQQASASQSARRKFDEVLQAANDELMRLRLSEGPIHTVFEKTVLFLLQQHGPLTTLQLYSLIQNIHPDLCDDSVDRVIDGRHYGKKWKHAVRTAQQQLKRKGLVTLADDKWHMI